MTFWYFYYNNTNLTDGNYTYEAHASDTNSNWNSTEERNLVVDLTPPAVTIHLPTNNTFTEANMTFNLTATDNYGISYCWFTTDGGTKNITMD